ncbi:MAG: hypothetical protein LBJ00_11950 [Planctomycetaceae bacterium]|nr:hypothetical protein [Planctomycetaceae bacterium]
MWINEYTQAVLKFPKLDTQKYTHRTMKFSFYFVTVHTVLCLCGDGNCFLT